MDSWSHYPERTVLNESKYVTRVDLIDLDFLWDKWLLHIWFLELIIRLQIEISRVRLIYVAANESGNVTRVKSCLELTYLIDLCIPSPQNSAGRAEAVDGARPAEERAGGGEARRERGHAADGAVQGLAAEGGGRRRRPQGRVGGGPHLQAHQGDRVRRRQEVAQGQ